MNEKQEREVGQAKTDIREALCKPEGPSAEDLKKYPNYYRLRKAILEAKKPKGQIWFPIYFDKHREDEYFDEVKVVILPRYKTSGLSGDEWRFTHQARLFWKGQQIGHRNFLNLQDALREMDWWVRNINELVKFRFKEYDDGSHLEELINFPDEKLRVEYCAQPGCPNKATHTFIKKKKWTKDGMAEVPMHGVHAIRFCQQHTTRGDCALEDADKNLELFEALEEEDHSERISKELGSGFGGVIAVDPE